MSSPASIARHPIHPILVNLPIGLWVFSVVADLIFRRGWGGAIWRDVALYCTGGGIVGALLAAVPGFIDFLSVTDARVQRLGFLHMIANLLAVAIFAVSFVLRWAGYVGMLPVWISILALVALSMAGWLGGELVFVHRMGVKPPHVAARRRHAADSERRTA
jgi:uncharacterized membrane protein